MIHSDPPVIPLVAASREEQLRESLGALELRLSAEHMQLLNDAMPLWLQDSKGTRNVLLDGYEANVGRFWEQ